MRAWVVELRREGRVTTDECGCVRYYSRRGEETRVRVAEVEVVVRVINVPSGFYRRARLCCRLSCKEGHDWLWKKRLL
jgi:hypothetical protein